MGERMLGVLRGSESIDEANNDWKDEIKKGK